MHLSIPIVVTLFLPIQTFLPLGPTDLGSPAPGLGVGACGEQTQASRAGLQVGVGLSISCPLPEHPPACGELRTRLRLRQ